MFIDLANNINAVPILVTQARLVDKNNTPEEKLIIETQSEMAHKNILRAYEKIDEIIKGVSVSKKVHVVDASKTISGKIKYFIDAVHTSKEGSYQLAKIVSDSLFNLIKK
jgi:hypothetical protein